MKPNLIGQEPCRFCHTESRLLPPRQTDAGHLSRRTGMHMVREVT